MYAMGSLDLPARTEALTFLFAEVLIPSPLLITSGAFHHFAPPSRKAVPLLSQSAVFMEILSNYLQLPACKLHDG